MAGFGLSEIRLTPTSPRSPFIFLSKDKTMAHNCGAQDEYCTGCHEEEVAKLRAELKQWGQYADGVAETMRRVISERQNALLQVEQLQKEVEFLSKHRAENITLRLDIAAKEGERLGTHKAWMDLNTEEQKTHQE